MSALVMAYADPPYLGKSRKFYADHPDAEMWDNPVAHTALIRAMCDLYPDGWAMSCSVPSLRVLLPASPPDVRTGAWVKPFCVFKKGVRPAYAWEPVLFRGGRNAGHPPPPKGGAQTTPKDFVIAGHADGCPCVAANITLRKGLTGAKPAEFCDWVLDVLNARPGDQVDDLFPGTGAMTAAIERRCAA